MGIYHVGTEEEVTIATIAQKVAASFGRDLDLHFGPPAPGGTPRRCPNTAKVRALGFAPKVTLDEGIRKTVAWYAQK
jgi:dTDP-glucose 4,6-dehydratase/UDP-glucose 4-epimerase